MNNQDLHYHFNFMNFYLSELNFIFIIYSIKIFSSKEIHSIINYHFHLNYFINHINSPNLNLQLYLIIKIIKIIKIIIMILNQKIR
jgi:hypothetical protein